MQKVTIYTDGGAKPNPGPGGWGAVLIDAETGEIRELSGGSPQTTNNRMELSAAIEALNSLKKPHQVELYTDSTYLKKGITEWVDTWAANKWRSFGNREVQNVDLWQELYALRDKHLIDWHWVRGHTGNDLNERAHQLASEAIPPPAEDMDDEGRTKVYLRVAGHPSGKPDISGWAALVIRDEEQTQLKGVHRSMSANQFLIRAALEVLRQLPPEEPIAFYTNATYLYDGITQWVENWKADDWARNPKFVSMWKALDEENQRRDIQWVLVYKDKAPPEFRKLERTARSVRDLERLRPGD